MPAGSAVTYRVNSPINRWRVFAFTHRDDAKLEFAASPDGKTYQPVAVTREAFAAGQTVYGYLTPVLFSADSAPEDVRYLRISVPGTTEDGAAGNSTAKPAPVEIGRVEIEYDHAERQTADTPTRHSGGPAPVNAAIFVDHPRFIQARWRPECPVGASAACRSA